MGWQAFIRLADPGGGGHTWTIDEATGEAPDETVVLDDLKFGWQMPRGIWPQQPEPMVATFNLSVPEFADIDELAPGYLCSIEVKADAAGPVVARFYGDVTDLEAGPRQGRTGVLLSVVAVDVTVRSRAFWSVAAPVFTNPMLDAAAAETLWSYWLGSSLGASVWATWARSVSVSAEASKTFRQLLDQLLLQAYGDAGTRMILAPIIDPASGNLSIGVTARSPEGRGWTLDTVGATPHSDAAPWVLLAGAVERSSLRHLSAKGLNAGFIDVTGWAENPENVVTYSTGAGGDDRATVPTTFSDGGHAAALAAFYGTLWARWQVKQLRVLVTRAGIGASVPVDLFPDWTATELTAPRRACYSRYVITVGADPTVVPSGLEVQGVLVGAELVITGGDLELNLELRIPGVPHPLAPVALGAGPYAETPHAELNTIKE